MDVVNEIYSTKKIFGMSCKYHESLDDVIEHNPTFILLEDLPGRFCALEHFLKYYERGPTLSVFITRHPLKKYSRSDLKKIYRENYDAVIENPNAREKNGSKKSAESKIIEQYLAKILGKK